MQDTTLLSLNKHSVQMSADSFYLKIFKEEVVRQCKFASMANSDLKQALKQRDEDRIWYSIQNLLVAIANISKLLGLKDDVQGQQSSKVPQDSFTRFREQLRSSLKIDENSSLKSRKFRNHFEHFDERLEQWISSSQHHNFIDSNLGALPKGLETADCHRNFDDSTYTLIFR
jgi:hypothetical protein